MGVDPKQTQFPDASHWTLSHWQSFIVDKALKYDLPHASCKHGEQTDFGIQMAQLVRQLEDISL